MDPERLYHDIHSGRIANAVVSDRTLWKVTGTDRVRYLNGQVTNDVGLLKAGSTIYAAILTPKGKLLGDLWIGATDDALWIDGPTSERDILETRLRRFLAADDVEFERFDDWRLHRIFTPSSFALPPDAVAFRSNRYGLPGWDLWTASAIAVDAGPPVPAALLESFRLEAGLPQWGAELHPGDLPQEVGLDPLAISYQKGCYVGQEVISRVHHIGHPNRALVLLAAPPLVEKLQKGAGLWRDGEEVGRITSVAHSFARRASIALGIVKRVSAAPGIQLRSGDSLLKVIEPLQPR
ncbi:hypothetical protein MAMC_01262 [Methylacidimicrobium cyclopophantes]|uniref:Aminomethyltransferase C-terminal domain-containing protein n=1 Tax=Methylacidimicrobium cyclopophantes TaxID=1041766 RepID=A0A5E6MN01_9BACT|nr:glycine cleavage T C-terminal barrel domain-containing protein [Methylacidimicrobium cyclopophantes]VVM06804.1 hypothetical protein MAMC_01262 [Methylacidimicrobium cyclopophantes]